MEAAGASIVVGNEEKQEDYHYLAKLPPGFRFHPTDEEIIIHYLLNKVIDRRFAALAIGEVDFNKCEPWDLPKKAKMGEKEWFFFFQKDKKYAIGTRTNRATESGYWKATGKDQEIHRGKTCLVGMKKILVFYTGRAPNGQKTNWIMHEYRLDGNFSCYNFSMAAKICSVPSDRQEEWVVCRVFHKKTGMETSPGVQPARTDSFVDHYLLNSPRLPPLMADNSCSSERPSSANFFATEEDEFRANISSSKLTFNRHQQKFLTDQNNFFAPATTVSSHNQYPSPQDHLNPNPIFEFCPQLVHPNSMFPYQSPSLVHLHQDGLNSTIERYHTNFLIKGADQPNSKILASNACIGEHELERAHKMETFSFNNPIVSHSQDSTGLSTEMAIDITSAHLNEDIESKKPCDQEFGGLSFSPTMTDLDFLWSY